MKTFTLTVLGTSSAVPTSERYTSAHMLNVCEHFYLFDCGEATQIRIRQERLPLSKINHIFISHLHGDHFFGLFGLLSSFQLHGRKNELHLYTHEGLQNIINTVIIEKVNLNFPISYHPLPTSKSEIILEDKNVIITAFPLKHRIPVCGFKVTEKQDALKIRKEKINMLHLTIQDILKIKKGEDYIDSQGNLIPNHELTLPSAKPRSYAYCSDTLYDESIIEFIDDVDLLYHEATFSEEHRDRALITGHSTAKQAASIAKKANVKKLIIGHYSVRYKDLSMLLDEAREVFPETYLAKEGLKIEI
ncbi:MAG TPA: ribonuclease Z [Bacteroidales bacterium]|nr:ribonuclease Z [Bacteroidales bacterium]